MKVCILGNNLTALTLAKAIVNQNIYVDILTEKKVLNLNKSRTIGISKSNLDFFNRNIINIKKLIWKLKKIDIFTDNLKNERLINFESKNSKAFKIRIITKGKNSKSVLPPPIGYRSTDERINSKNIAINEYREVKLFFFISKIIVKKNNNTIAEW